MSDDAFHCDGKDCVPVQLSKKLGGYFNVNCRNRHILCMQCALLFIEQPPNNSASLRKCPACEDGYVSSITPVGPTKVSSTRSEQFKNMNYKSHGLKSMRSKSIDIFDEDGKRTELDFDTDMDLNSISSDEKNALLKLFTWLHEQLVKPLHSNKRKDPSKLKPGTIDEQLTDMIKKNDGILFECIKILSVGSMEKLKELSADRSLAKQLYVAMENIVRGGNNKGSPLRSLMGEYCMTHIKDSGIHTLLNKLGVTHSRTMSSRVSNVEYITSLEKAPDLLTRLLDFVIIAYDNVGFTWRQGFRAKKSHLNYTLIKLIFVPYEELKRRGLYNGEKDWSNGKEWEEERMYDRSSLETVVLPSDKDYEALASIREGYLCTSLKLAEVQALPSIGLAKVLLLEQKQIIGELVIDDRSTLEDTIRDGGAEVVADYEEHIVYDTPMCKDIAKKDVVEEILRYGSEQVMKRLHDSIDEGLDDLKRMKGIEEDITPVMMKCKIFEATDGGPYGIATDLIYTDEIFKAEEERGEKRLVEPILGGFHLMLEMFKKSGPMFRNTHLRDVLHLWRESDKQIEWILTPSDPNQSEQETDIIHHATMHAALLGLLHKLKKELPNTTTFEVSAKMLDDHMTARASENPRCAAMLLQISFDCVIRMLKESERKGDRDLFLGGMKFTQMLFVNSNAYKYVMMVFHMMIMGYCASEAELELIELALFRKTTNGKLIYTDRSVEWSMKIVRRFLGRFYNRALDQRFKNLTNKLNDNEAFTRKSEIKKEAPQGTSAQSEQQNEKIGFNSIYLETLIYLDESRLWYEEPQRLVKSVPYLKRRRNASEPTFLSNNYLTSMSNSEVLHDDVLFILSRGDARIKDAYKEMRDSAKRKLKDRGSRFAFPNAATKKLNKLYDIAKTLDWKKVKRTRDYKKGICIAEIENHYHVLGIKEGDLIAGRFFTNNELRSSDMGKEELSKLVVRLRRDRMNRIKDSQNLDAAGASEEWERVCVEEFLIICGRGESAVNLTERLKDEMKHRFITLEGTEAKRRWANLKFRININEDDEGSDNEGSDNEDSDGVGNSNSTSNAGDGGGDDNDDDDDDNTMHFQPNSQFSHMTSDSYINNLN